MKRLLKRLRIRNLAVVEDVTLEFDTGLNVLTGSTGAGKSLILGAVNLLLGSKASADVIRAGEDAAVVEGEFETPQTPGEPGGSVVVKREVYKNGRSRAFVDGRQVPAKQLQKVSSRWIEPHGQSEQLRLKDPEAHVGFLDLFAGDQKLVDRYKEALAQFHGAERELSEFDVRVATLKEKEELLRHRIEEIDRARMRAGELEGLENKIRLLENAEKISEALGYVYDALDDDESGAAVAVAKSMRRLSNLAGVDERIGAFLEQLDEVEISLRDCADGVRAYLDGFEFDPEYLRSLHERRSYLLELERRYGMKADEIIAKREQWASELESVAVEDEERRELSERVDEKAQSLKRAASRLSETRKKAAVRLDRRMTKELNALMISGARFRTEIRTVLGPESDVRRVSAAARSDGADAVRFMVVTNPGEDEGPVDEIASSGETSRISLALRISIEFGKKDGASRGGDLGSGSSERLCGPGSVLVFDEVDAGVGADLGSVIANKLLELSESYQIICITHMPQIAAAGNRHLVVAKRSSDGRTAARVSTASGEERRREIARMLGGESGSDRRLALAGELLGERRAGGGKSVEERP